MFCDRTQPWAVVCLSWSRCDIETIYSVSYPPWTVKCVSAFGLTNNKWQWWVKTIVTHRGGLAAVVIWWWSVAVWRCSGEHATGMGQLHRSQLQLQLQNDQLQLQLQLRVHVYVLQVITQNTIISINPRQHCTWSQWEIIVTGWFDYSWKWKASFLAGGSSWVSDVWPDL